MVDKKDFMGALAQELEDKKTGKKERIENVDDFEPKAKPRPVEDVFAMPKMEEKPVEQTQTAQSSFQEIYTSETNEEKGGILPDSYGQETFQKIEKPKRTISKKAIAFIIIALLLLAGLLYWLLWAPKITMPNFVGKNISDVSSWARQNKMEASAIATKEEYNFEYASNIVIDQSVAEGKKVKPSTPITITVSKGADPSEEINFPSDLRSMTKDEIEDWIQENKLQKTKITTQFSTTVENGHVISYELKNTDEGSFERGSTLNIVVSKGPAPAGQVTVENFEGKTLAEAQTWANNKKLTFNKEEAFSDTVDSGRIMSQSVKAGEALKEGDVFTVVVSKGKGIHIPNLVGYSKEQLDAWQANKNNTVVVIPSSRYNTAPEGTVIAQSIAPGTVVESGEVLELGISLYLPILETHSREWLGKDYLQLKAKIDEFNSHGANIQAGQYGDFQWNICSDTYPTPGQIIDYACLYGTSDLADGCGRPLNLDSRVAYTISTGACTVDKKVLHKEDMQSLARIQQWCVSNGLTYSIDPSPMDKNTFDGNVEITLKNGTRYIKNSNEYPVIIDKDEIINIHWNYEKETNPPTPTATTDGNG